MAGGVKKRGAVGTWPQRLPRTVCAAGDEPHAIASAAGTPETGTVRMPDDMAGTGAVGAVASGAESAGRRDGCAERSGR